jgi:hypothetical protein
MIRILHFGNDAGKEYVVLTEDPKANPEEYAKPGYKLVNDIETDADSGTLPMESVLVKES